VTGAHGASVEVLKDGEAAARRGAELIAAAAAEAVAQRGSLHEKRGPLGKLLAGDQSIPAGRVEARDPVVITDIAGNG
jgi:hypothetical protein